MKGKKKQQQQQRASSGPLRRKSKKDKKNKAGQIAADARFSRIATSHGIPQCEGKAKGLICRIAARTCLIFGQRGVDNTRFRGAKTVQAVDMIAALKAAGFIISPHACIKSKNSKKRAQKKGVQQADQASTA